MRERKRRKMTILFTVTFLAFVLLLFLPSTGWIVRQQLRMLFTTAPEKALMLLLGIKAKYIGLSESKAQKLEEWVKQRLKDAAERNPKDLPVQISSVLLTTPHTEVPKTAARTSQTVSQRTNLAVCHLEASLQSLIKADERKRGCNL